MVELTISEIIEGIDDLIEAGEYDAGRLDNIRESLRHNKPLFNSDQLYLEKLLGSPIIIKNEEISPNPLLPFVKKLIDSGSGDYGRLQSIYDLLLKGKSLYQSDQIYLQKKLDETSDDSISLDIDDKDTLVETKDENQSSKDTLHTKGAMPKGWDENKSVTNESDGVNENNLEENNVQEPTSFEPENPELSKIKQTSQEQKKQIESVNRDLDSQIKIERENIASNINQFKQITEQRDELKKIKIETLSVLDKIKKEREDLLKESKLQKEELIHVQKEQEEIEKEIQQEQIDIEERRESQKSHLFEKTKLLKQLGERELELENTKTQFDKIQDELEKEKRAIATESAQQKENLAKLQSEKKSLEATQSEYDSLLAQIEQEKQDIAADSKL
ncbi:MAG: hypothetical protein OEL52_06045, partial [Nitrosopumilus sp.]|nr:hypothetical protein [Nitrosopumilus sp.]